MRSGCVLVPGSRRKRTPISMLGCSAGTARGSGSALFLGETKKEDLKTTNLPAKEEENYDSSRSKSFDEGKAKDTPAKKEDGVFQLDQGYSAKEKSIHQILEMELRQECEDWQAKYESLYEDFLKLESVVAERNEI